MTAICTFSPCARPAIFQERRYPSIQLCGEHFQEYSAAFMEWLWKGTPETLEHWLKTFRQAGGTFKE